MHSEKETIKNVTNQLDPLKLFINGYPKNYYDKEIDEIFNRVSEITDVDYDKSQKNSEIVVVEVFSDRFNLTDKDLENLKTLSTYLRINLRIEI